MLIHLPKFQLISLLFLLRSFIIVSCLDSKILSRKPVAFLSHRKLNILKNMIHKPNAYKHMNKHKDLEQNAECSDDFFHGSLPFSDDDGKLILTGIETHVQLASPSKAFCSCRSIASPLTTLNLTENPDIYKTLPAENRRKVFNGFKKVLEDISKNYSPTLNLSDTHFDSTKPLDFEHYVKLYYDSKESENHGDIDEKTLNSLIENENQYTCPGCRGEVGATPYISPISFLYAVGVCKVFNCNISNNVSFDRKCYDYFDLPKGYQITQTLNPLGRDGRIELSTGKVVKVKKVQFEEDTARRVDVNGVTNHLDFNRSGVALAEVVTAPTEMTRSEILETCKKIYELVVLNGLSNGNRFRGNFRFDINLSRSDGSNRVEVKNLNSFVKINKCVKNYDPEKEYVFKPERPSKTSVLDKLMSEEENDLEKKDESILEKIQKVFLSVFERIPDGEKYTPLGTTLTWDRYKGLRPTRAKLPSDCYGNYFESNIPVIYQSDDLIKRIVDCLPKSVEGVEFLFKKYPDVNRELLKEIYKYPPWTEYYEKLCTFVNPSFAASHFVNLLLPLVKSSHKLVMPVEKFSSLLNLIMNYKVNLTDVEKSLPDLVDYSGSPEDYFRTNNLLLHDIDTTKGIIDHYFQKHPIDYTKPKDSNYITKLTSDLVRSVDCKISYHFVRDYVTNVLNK